MQGANLVATALADAGVKHVFTLSGNQIMPLFDAFIDAGIQPIHVRHESAAVHMADAWAQLSGDVGIAMVAAGPGFVNAVPGLFSSRASESPLVLLSGDSPLSEDDTGAFQELDQVAASRPFTKLSVRSLEPTKLHGEITDAIDLSRSGRTGPVHIALPYDVLCAEVSTGSSQSKAAIDHSDSDFDPIFFHELSECICRARRPLILTGPMLNRSRAGPLISKLETSLATPVIPIEHARALNDASLGEFDRLVTEADFALFLGKRIDFSVHFGSDSTFGVNCKFAIVDPDAHAMRQSLTNLGGKTVLNSIADPRLIASKLTESMAVPSSPDPTWNKRVAAALKARPQDPASIASESGIGPRFVCETLARQIDDCADTTLIVDGGEFGQWAQAYIDVSPRISNGLSGAIGAGVCYAIAAKLQRPESNVFAIMGDGTVGFHLSEFETAVRYGLPFVAIVGNDARWNAEYQIQLRDYGSERLIGCELTPARYDLAVAGLGGHGEYVSKAEDLAAAIERAIASELPACVNVKLDGLPAPSFV